MTREIDLRVPHRTDAASIARKAMDQLAGYVSPETLDDSRLLLSELVTNALRHGVASGEIGIRITLDGGKLRAEVRDDGPGFTPTPRTPGSADDSGWGLFLVSELADRWGISSDGNTLVWFELAAE